MDAKPIRPLRTTRVHDENAVPAPSKVVHQRHKSTPALSNILQFGAAKNPNQKRAAFADVSNQRGAKDDSNAAKGKPVQNTKEKDNTRKPLLGKQPIKPSTIPTSISASQLPATKADISSKTQQRGIPVHHDIEAALGNIRSQHEDALLDQALRQVIAQHPAQRPETHMPVQVLPSQPLSTETQQQESKAIPLRSHEYYDSEYEYATYEGDYNSRKSLGMVSDTTGGVTIVLAPKYTAKIQKEIADAKEFVDANRTQEDIEDDHWDTSMVAEYGDEIFDYMRKLEERMRPNPHYMDHQTECQWSMRAVLLDWLVQVHARFTLLPETLFLSVNYIDRFLSAKIVSLAKLQLVGATALFLAAKYEEVNCPSILEIVYMVDNGYSVEEILKAERFMLSMLAFELGWPGPMSFLRRISKADDYDLETRTLAKYFLEVTIMDERFLSCPPSSTAAAAHCLARLMLRKGEWTQAHVYYSNYTYAQLQPLLRVIVECCENPVQHHAAVYSKYQDKRYKKSSIFVQQEMQSGFRLPPVQNRNSSFGMVDLSISQGWRDLN